MAYSQEQIIFLQDHLSRIVGRRPKKCFDLYDPNKIADAKAKYAVYLNSHGIKESSRGIYAFVAVLDPEIGEGNFAFPTFLYPKGRSGVFYIGRSYRPHNRFWTHWSEGGAANDHLNVEMAYKTLTDSKLRHKQERSLYSAETAPLIFWWDCRGDKCEIALEEKALKKFITIFGTLPRTNEQGGTSKRRKKRGATQR